jgi:hypothetical protein
MRIRNILFAAAAPAAIAGVLLTTGGAAHAATVTAGPGTSNGQVSHITGKNAISYDDAVFGKVQVNETQHPNFDTVSAKFVDASGKPVVNPNFQPGQVVVVGWNSDFGGDGTTSVHQVTGTLTATINATDTGYDGQATYPPAS